MTRSEISHQISQLERDISGAASRRADAEKNIRQLVVLNACCNDYQTELESARIMRKMSLEKFNEIFGQTRLVGAYGGAMEELVNGSAYVSAYGSMDEAKAEISREIERQRQIINECNGRIAGANGSISYWRQQLANADKEVENAGYGVSY